MRLQCAIWVENEKTAPHLGFVAVENSDNEMCIVLDPGPFSSDQVFHNRLG